MVITSLYEDLTKGLERTLAGVLAADETVFVKLEGPSSREASTSDPSKLPNCIVVGRFTAPQFRHAASFIMERVARSHHTILNAEISTVQDDNDILAKIERAALLHREGTITDKEFIAIKKEIFSRKS